VEHTTIDSAFIRSIPLICFLGEDLIDCVFENCSEVVNPETKELPPAKQARTIIKVGETLRSLWLLILLGITMLIGLKRTLPPVTGMRYLSWLPRKDGQSKCTVSYLFVYFDYTAAKSYRTTWSFILAP